MKNSRTGLITLVVAAISLAIIDVASILIALDRYVLAQEKTSGTLSKKMCRSSGLIYADYGRFEHLVKIGDGEYLSLPVPKTLCGMPKEGEVIKYSVGKLTDVVVSAKFHQDWNVFYWYHLLSIVVMTLGFLAIRKKPMRVQKTVVFLVSFAMFRFLIATF